MIQEPKPAVGDSSEHTRRSQVAYDHLLCRDLLLKFAMYLTAEQLIEYEIVCREPSVGCLSGLTHDEM